MIRCSMISPPPRSTPLPRPTMAYDSKSDRIVLFGGFDPGLGPYGNVTDDTWSYDLNANTWTNLTLPTKPSVRQDHAMAYDSESDRIVLFAGVGFIYLGDTWSYDLDTNNWSVMNPTDVRPASRFEHAMAYDSESDRIVLLGGGSKGGTLGDTWSYNLNTNTWTYLSLPNLGCFGHAMAYDSESDRVVQFGGYGEPGILGDTWLFEHFLAPSPPQALEAIGADSRVALTWQAPHSDGNSPITNFTVYRGTVSGNLSLLTTVGDFLVYNDTGLTNGVTYYYQVSAVNAIGESPRTLEHPATPAQRTPPSASQNVQAIAGDTEVTLTWQAPASNGGFPITAFKVYRGFPSGGESPLANLGDGLEYLDSAVAHGQT